MNDAIVADPQGLGPWIEAELPEIGQVTRIVKFPGGQSNPTYRIEGRDRTVVLRAKPPGKLLPSAHAVGREFRVMRALTDSPVPVPRMLRLIDGAASPLGRDFYLMDHVAGRVFWDPALPDQTPLDRAAIYDAMNVTLAALHRIDPETAGLADFGRPGDYFARQTDRWTRQYSDSVETPLPEMQVLIDWLARNQPGDDGQIALVHGDFRLDNLIFAPDTPVVRALLDWELSTLGHPVADLAYQCMQWRMPHSGGPEGMMRGLGGLDRTALGVPDEPAYVAAYCARRGLPGIAHWTFCLAFSFFRLAAILEGVAARARAGNASNSARARAYGASVPGLAAMAVELIREGAE